MKNKKYFRLFSDYKGIIIGFLIAAILFSVSGVAAQSIEALFNSVKIMINGETAAEINENYTLSNGTSVPFSILYEGTTYLPLRKVSELLKQEITWDNDTRTVSVMAKDSAHKALENAYACYPDVYDFGILSSLNTVGISYTIRSTVYWYDTKLVTDEMVNNYKAKLLEAGFIDNSKKYNNHLTSYIKDNIEVILDPKLYKDLVYSITVSDNLRPAAGKTAYYEEEEKIPDFGKMYGYSSQYSESTNVKTYSYSGDWDLWANFCDYVRALVNYGYTCTDVDKGGIGNRYIFEGNDITITVGLLSKEFLPTFDIKVIE